jgi:hypothetical protein
MTLAPMDIPMIYMVTTTTVSADDAGNKFMEKTVTEKKAFIIGFLAAFDVEPSVVELDMAERAWQREQDQQREWELYLDTTHRPISGAVALKMRQEHDDLGWV